MTDLKNTPLRLLAAAAAAGLLALTPGRASAQNPWPPGYQPGTMGIPQPEPKITLSVQNRSVNKVLYEIFKQTNWKYQVVAEVGTTVVNVDFKQTPLTAAIRATLRQVKTDEPLVFSFQKNAAGQGIFLIDREYIQVGVVDGENQVSLSNARLTEVLPLVFRLMGAKYRVEPDVPAVPLSAQLRPQNWAAALPQLILTAGKMEPALTYSMDKDTYVVHLHKTPPVPGSAAVATGMGVRRVNVIADNKPLRDVLALLFQGSRWKYQVSDAVKDTRVTFTAANQFELAALYSLLGQMTATGQQVTYREGNQVLYIEPGPLPGEAVVVDRAAVTAGSPQKRVSLNLSQSLRKVVMALAQLGGAVVRVAPNVPDVPVAFMVQNTPFEDALFQLVQRARVSVPNLTVRNVGANTWELEISENAVGM